MPTSSYGTIRHQHLISFPGTVEGSEDALFCTVSTQPLNTDAHHALNASANRLGYSLRQCVFLSTATKNDGSNTPTDAENQEMLSSVSPQQLMEAIEAIDPFCVVLTDHKAVELASAAYNTPLALETREHLLGKGCCCFDDFETLLSSNEGKQKAWACLKTLPQIR